MHDAAHEGMQGAGVLEVTLAGKGMFEFVVGIQAFCPRWKLNRRNRLLGASVIPQRS